MSSFLASLRTTLSRTHPRPPCSITHTPTSCIAPTSSSSPSLPSPTLVRHARVIVQKRAREGLYAGKHIQFGNAVSHSHHKTRRTWQPNAQQVTLHSQLLQQSITLHATTHALRCIDKAGGLDAWVLGEDRRKLVGKALELREKMEVVYAPIRRQERYEERVRRRAEKAAAAGEATADRNSAAAGGVAAMSATGVHSSATPA